ncbi:hypothetical protein BSL78_20976 [Apostichopus japonicus]|uniref:Fibrinogen C-terminal domain-containing protein n=1 Tax=Stichopus japonicus TaxID=307972 RepID=A0A2G8K2E6_STIJA|nr:hypothetical protein BSL78_20976 [Apostichopus japonicus]
MGIKTRVPGLMTSSRRAAKDRSYGVVDSSRADDDSGVRGYFRCTRPTPGPAPAESRSTVKEESTNTPTEEGGVTNDEGTDVTFTGQEVDTASEPTIHTETTSTAIISSTQSPVDVTSTVKEESTNTPTEEVGYTNDEGSDVTFTGKDVDTAGEPTIHTETTSVAIISSTQSTVDVTSTTSDPSTTLPAGVQTTQTSINQSCSVFMENITILDHGSFQVNENCTKKFTCTNGNTRVNEEYTCSSRAECDKRNGVRKCYCERGYQGEYQIRIDLVNMHGVPYYAKYDLFRINDESDNYTLSGLGTFNGTADPTRGSIADDALRYHVDDRFSTFDSNSGTCTEDQHGAWWHEGCSISNLNGEYNGTGQTGIKWNKLPGGEYNITYTEMKIRPR